MKFSVGILIISLLLSPFTFAQTGCSTYYPLEEGVTFQYTTYNKKGKSEGIANHLVTKAHQDKGLTSASMQINLIDQKGKEIYKTDYNFTCDSNSVKIDYESLIPNQMLAQYKGMDMTISGTAIEIPNNLSVGQQLPDANVSVKISMSGINMNMNVDMINRKVEKQESITTAAGTFDCLVVYSENKTKMMMVNSTFPSRIWLAKGVGMVKQESYNKNGKLMGTTELTTFNK